MVKELAEHFEAGKALADYPYEMLDENRWLAARHGLDGELVDLPSSSSACRRRRSRAASTTGSPSTRRTSARPPSSRASSTCSRRGNGAARQQVVYEANHDLHEVVREIAAATVPE